MIGIILVKLPLSELFVAYHPCSAVIRLAKHILRQDGPALSSILRLTHQLDSTS